MQFLSELNSTVSNEVKFSLRYLVAACDFNNKGSCASNILFNLNTLPRDANLI